MCLPPLSLFLHALNWIFKLVLFLLSCTLPITLFLSIWIESLILLYLSFLPNRNGDRLGLQLLCSYAIHAWKFLLKGTIWCLLDKKSTILPSNYYSLKFIFTYIFWPNIFHRMDCAAKNLEMNISKIKDKVTLNIFRHSFQFFM